MLEISDSELRRRISLLRGKQVKRRIDRPLPGTGKSTDFRMIDLALLSRVDKSDLSNFMAYRRQLGELTKARLYSKLREIEGGFITKSQLGVYHFHDEPQRQASVVMQIDLQTGVFVKPQEPGAGGMPSFKKLFGG